MKLGIWMLWIIIWANAYMVWVILMVLWNFLRGNSFKFWMTLKARRHVRVLNFFFLFLFAPPCYLGGRRWSRWGPRDRVQIEERQGRDEVHYQARSVPQVSHYKVGGMGGTGEEVGGGVVWPSAWGTEGVRRYIDPVYEAVKGGDVPRTKLGEGGTEAAGEKFLLICHRFYTSQNWLGT